jgi:ubiquinone/menaquinone biosynthesis C-methylase UbiE
MTDWDRFFDEQYLRTYMPRLDELDSSAEAVGAVALADCPKGGDVLDCPCGWGRHAIPLTEAGFHVVGADRSETQLREARRRDARTTWVQADYRDLPFDDGSFDCVLNLFSSLGYVGEAGDRQALAEFRRVLRPGGALVIETMHRDLLAWIFRQRTWEALPDDGLLLESRRFDQITGTMHDDHVYIDGDGTRHTFSYAVRTYTATEIDGMVRSAGFGRVDYYGGYGAEAFDWDTRLVAVARA